jgi:hypothetical protein
LEFLEALVLDNLVGTGHGHYIGSNSGKGDRGSVEEEAVGAADCGTLGGDGVRRSWACFG